MNLPDMPPWDARLDERVDVRLGFGDLWARSLAWRMSFQPRKMRRVAVMTVFGLVGSTVWRCHVQEAFPVDVTPIGWCAACRSACIDCEFFVADRYGSRLPDLARFFRHDPGGFGVCAGGEKQKVQIVVLSSTFQ